MSENRRDERHSFRGRVQLLIASANGFVADISARGVRVRIAQNPRKALPEFESLLISPENGGIAPFNLSAMKRWHRSAADSTLVGYEIKSFVDPHSRERFAMMLEKKRARSE